MKNNILETALEAEKAGYSVIPIRPFDPADNKGDKRPAVNWKQYQTTRLTRQQIHNWFHTPGYGLGVIMGSISNDLVMVELEGRAAHKLPDLIRAAIETGLVEEWNQLTKWSETTPSGGWHFYVKVPGNMGRNRPLARRPLTNTEKQTSPTLKHKPLAETRENGGYSVIAPTGGEFHETGNPWVLHTGSPTTAGTLAISQYEELLNLFRSIDEMPPETPIKPARTPGSHGIIDPTRPGDDFETKTSWAEILTPHGWTPVFKTGTTTYWRRPGKKHGISATTGHATDRDRLFVFTTASVFDPETPYTKFGAYAALNHGGNYSEAARKLGADGYGQPAKQLVPNIPGTTPKPSGKTPTTRGSLALVASNPKPILEPSSPIYSEDYDALTFAEEFKHQIAYCPQWEKWLLWDGHTWQPQSKDANNIKELLKQHLRNLPDETKQDLNYKKKALSHNGITNRLAMARTDKRLSIAKNHLDQHPYELNTPSGIINLHTSTLTPPDPARWHTKTTRVTPKPTPTPKWERFLTQTFNDDHEIIAFFQRLAGYSATGTVQDHILPFLFGPGGNGKSVILDILTELLNDYATTAPAKFLMAGFNKHETEIARLDGARLVICSEINERDRFDEAKMKMLTGGDKLTARYMYQDYFEFTPTHKLWLMGNHQPKVESGGTSFWRRLQLIGFTNKIPKNEMIPNLSQILIKEEGPGILYWIIQGAKQYLEKGLRPPLSVINASAEYEKEEDSLSRFVETKLIIGGGEYVRVSSAEMMTAYRDWCQFENEAEMTATALGRNLRSNYGLGKIKNGGRMFFTNVTLANTDSDTPEDPWSELGGRR